MKNLNLVNFSLHQVDLAKKYTDGNVRIATMLGVVGAGGIGHELQSSFRIFEYERVSAIIILIFVIIFTIDHLSAFIRSKIK